MESNRENRPEVFEERTYKELEAVLWKADEDHLGAALIQPVSLRYRQMKWQEGTMTIW